MDGTEKDTAAILEKLQFFTRRGRPSRSRPVRGNVVWQLASNEREEAKRNQKSAHGRSGGPNRPTVSATRHAAIVFVDGGSEQACCV